MTIIIILLISKVLKIPINMFDKGNNSINNRYKKNEPTNNLVEHIGYICATPYRH